MKKNKKKIIEYWDSRAVSKNKKISGSNDELAHKFETNFNFKPHLRIKHYYSSVYLSDN